MAVAWPRGVVIDPVAVKVADGSRVVAVAAEAIGVPVGNAAVAVEMAGVTEDGVAVALAPTDPMTTNAPAAMTATSPIATRPTRMGVLLRRARGGVKP
jgi:hypothetical protein